MNKWYALHSCAVMCLPLLLLAIDHNPSSTTARDSFDCIAISLIQHPSFVGEGTDRRLLVLSWPEGGCSTTIDRLPAYCTEVPPVACNIKVSQVPDTRIESIAFHASSQTLGIRATCSTVILPLFQQNFHAVAMMKHFTIII